MREVRILARDDLLEALAQSLRDRADLAVAELLAVHRRHRPDARRGSGEERFGRAAQLVRRHVTLLARDTGGSTTRDKTFDVIRWVIRQRNKQPTHGLHCLGCDPPNRLPLPRALGRVFGVTDRVARAALQHAVKARAGAGAQDVVLDESNLTPAQDQIAGHHHVLGGAIRIEFQDGYGKDPTVPHLELPKPVGDYYFAHTPARHPNIRLLSRNDRVPYQMLDLAARGTGKGPLDVTLDCLMSLAECHEFFELGDNVTLDGVRGIWEGEPIIGRGVCKGFHLRCREK